MPKLQIVSDVHSRWQKVHFSPQADLILAAGDICEGFEGAQWLRESGKPVLYVPGNHEFYGFDLLEMEEKTKKETSARLWWLHNQSASIGSMRILGATLWSDFHGMDPMLLRETSRNMNDYRSILVSSWIKEPENQAHYLKTLTSLEEEHLDMRGAFPRNPTHLNPVLAMVLHERSIVFLARELAKPWSGKTIVMTHHAPSVHSLLFGGYLARLDARPKLQKFLRKKYKPHKIGAYCSSLEYLFSHNKIDLWVHGHLHEGLRYSLYGADIFTNPTGYDDSQNPNYRSSMVLDIDNPHRHTRTLVKTLEFSLEDQEELLQLAKRALLAEKTLARELFADVESFASFSKIYNQALSILTQQSPKDRFRASFMVEPLNFQRLLSRRSALPETLDDAQRSLFLRDFVTLMQTNEQKTRDWRASLESDLIEQDAPPETDY